MIRLPFDLPAAGRFDVGRAPEGVETLLLAAIARARPGRGIVHVARDDLAMARIVDALRFFAPDCETIAFPAWDCLPYDRASPHRDILARRVDALSELARRRKDGRALPIVVTTIAAFLQKVNPPEAFADRILNLRCGTALPPERLTAFLAGNGYYQSATVTESGEFAVRGGLIDLFPPGTAQPLRVDFFGEEIEAIRPFDPLSQRSLGQLDSFHLKPVNEAVLTPESIAAFRTGYREAFGAADGEDPLYEAISAGRAFPGMEHWLPLFGGRMAALTDYLPEAVLSFDPQAEEAKAARLDLIKDFHQARTDLAGAGRKAGEAVYKALPPDRLYLEEEDWKRLQRGRLALFLHTGGGEGGTWLDAGGRAGLSFAEARVDPAVDLYESVARSLKAELAAGERVILAAFSQGAAERLGQTLARYGLVDQVAAADGDELQAAPPRRLARIVLGLERGFRHGDLLLVTETDILGERLTRSVQRKRRTIDVFAELGNFAPGDLVVHADHGIGRYEGLESLDVGGAPHDCLRLVYAGNDKLFVPVENIDTLSRYGSEAAGIELDKLGGTAWQSRKARVKQRIRDITQQLLRTAAARQLRRSEPLTPPDGLFERFCARFPYAETDDQLNAIADVLGDLASGRPMDRLVCGDVGFGKTEVALRAAFIAAAAGRQVAVVAPTTLLSRQHFRTFSERFQGFPFRLRQLSRLVGAAEKAETRTMLTAGGVDIVIGTHALLAKGVQFADLGLLIIDEEQHFGVAQKERLKELRADVNVLTLTATPIPRTLQLALSGIREMSLIATAPIDRLAVRTFALPYDPVIVRQAIMRERFRGGQIFYVSPRIEDLDLLAERIARLVPDLKFTIAHGGMSPTQLEKAMGQFYDRSCELLLSTNIIESGLDIPSANTMIVHRADLLGLAQLYQLRGRIGRGKLRGYCYLTTPPGRETTPAATRRLEVMQALDQLGAGFSLASHDLDIRGAGNLLGEEQSGQVREVGVELYQSLLAEAVAEARGQDQATRREAWSPQIALGMPVLIPDSYVADLGVRLGLYRRIAALESDTEAEAFAAELIDRFGPLPEAVENLLGVVAIKRASRQAGIEKLEAGPKGATLAFRDNRFARPDLLLAFIQRHAALMSVRGADQKLVHRADWPEGKARILGVRRLAEALARMAGGEAAS